MIAPIKTAKSVTKNSGLFSDSLIPKLIPTNQEAVGYFQSF